MGDNTNIVIATTLAYGVVFLDFYAKTRNLSLSEYKQYISDWYTNETEPDKIFLELTEFVLEQKEKK